VVIHALLDGRDTPPRSASIFVPDLVARLAEAHPGARIATLAGRYYGMDRDRRWDRTKSFYDAMVHGDGLRAPSVDAALADAYERGENDEFVEPTVIDGVDGRVRDGDVVVHFNFRADRARQLAHALADGDAFDGFDRGARPRDLLLVTLAEYEAGLPVAVAFPPIVVPSLAEIFSGLGWRQLHIAETEKYAHVTYFFNGGVEAPWPGEERVLVPSPGIATYDLQPEMSARGVTDALVGAIEGDTFDFMLANYANPDMVGHTGVWDATVRACEVVDACLGRVATAVLERDRRSVAAGGPGALLCITADHGNADEMRDAAGMPVTAHSLNPVPVLLAGAPAAGLRIHDGVLADVAPTLLELMDVPPAEGMTGHSLIVR
jgi:2,3-bisphosphoglycerate-independent phosphoglycerate mutase